MKDFGDNSFSHFNESISALWKNILFQWRWPLRFYHRAEEPKQQLLRQINLIIQWNNLQTYRYCVIRFPDLRNWRWNKKNWFTTWQRLLWKDGTSYSIKMENIIWESAGCSKQYIRTIREIKLLPTSRIWKFTSKGYGSPMVFTTTTVQRNLCPTSRRIFWNRLCLALTPNCFRYQTDRLPNNFALNCSPWFSTRLSCRSGWIRLTVKTLCWPPPATTTTEWRRRKPKTSTMQWKTRRTRLRCRMAWTVVWWKRMESWRKRYGK